MPVNLKTQQIYSRCQKDNYVYIYASDRKSGAYIKVPKKMVEDIPLQIGTILFELFIVRAGRSNVIVYDAYSGAKLHEGSSVWESVMNAGQIILDKGASIYQERQQDFIRVNGLSPAFEFVRGDGISNA